MGLDQLAIRNNESKHRRVVPLPPLDVPSFGTSALEVQVERVVPSTNTAPPHGEDGVTMPSSPDRRPSTYRRTQAAI